MAVHEGTNTTQPLFFTFLIQRPTTQLPWLCLTAIFEMRKREAAIFWLICVGVTYLQPRWTWGKRRTIWREQANLWGTVSVHLWWCWCLHRRWLRCLSSRHLWWWKKRSKRAQLSLLLLGILTKEPLWFSGLFLFWLQLRMPSRAGRGLLVLADWTSQCCELKWHFVMDDLPHANLAISLAQCSRAFLPAKIHTGLVHDRLILTASSAESQNRVCYRRV